MSLKQVSIFIENKEGRLADVTRCLADGKIDIRALSLADTADFGMLRLIVNDHEMCTKILKERGFMVQETEVLAVEVEDAPGGLASVLDCLTQAKLNVEYMYASIERRKEKALVIFRVDDRPKAESVLQSCGIKLCGAEEFLTNS
jgi:hypothetical protein